MKVRKALSWKSCNKLKKIWKSPLCKPLKLRSVLTLVESVLLYRNETRTLTKCLEKSIDGTYNRLLRTVFNVSWSDLLTNRELYGNLPKVTEKIRERRLKLAGHIVRQSEEVASNLVLWKPSHGKPNRGRKGKTYLDNLMNDTNMERVDELQSLIMDRDLWSHLVNNCCSGSGWCPT